MLDSRKSWKPWKWRELRESGVQNKGSPNNRFRNTRASGRNSERPWKRSQSFSWKSRQEHGWEHWSPINQGIWSLQSMNPEFFPLNAAGDASFRQNRFGASWKSLFTLRAVCAISMSRVKHSLPIVPRQFLNLSYPLWNCPSNCPLKWFNPWKYAIWG